MQPTPSQQFRQAPDEVWGWRGVVWHVPTRVIDCAAGREDIKPLGRIIYLQEHEPPTSMNLSMRILAGWPRVLY